jgi:hypothetical protein
MADATERWLPVVGHKGIYEASDLGRVRRVAAWANRPGRRPLPDAALKPWPDRWGYQRLILFKNGQKHHCSVHEVVLEAFVGPRPAGLKCNHKDGDKANNLLSNLEWVTSSENDRHAFALGLRTSLRGEQYWNAKLTWQQVREIRRLVGSEPIKVTAARFGISPNTVSNIRRGRTWQEQPSDMPGGDRE